MDDSNSNDDTHIPQFTCNHHEPPHWKIISNPNSINETMTTFLIETILLAVPFYDHFIGIRWQGKWLKNPKGFSPLQHSTGVGLVLSEWWKQLVEERLLGFV